MAEEEVSIRDIVGRFIFDPSSPSLLPFFFPSPSFPIPFSSSCAQLSRDCSLSSCLRFIAASPSGELQFVLSDLRALVNQDEFDLQAELPALVAE
jgi:hypothetical protein